MEATKLIEEYKTDTAKNPKAGIIFFWLGYTTLTNSLLICRTQPTESMTFTRELGAPKAGMIFIISNSASTRKTRRKAD